jgi:peptidoglycan/xylan/chitin deacetylase (PgdA/CDA1 family)
LKISILLKTVYASILFRSGIVNWKLARRNNEGYFSILMYHRIIPADDKIQSGMYVTPETFENHLRYLRKKFNVISLKELLLSFENRSCASLEKLVCVLTFDDGWRDFYDHAFPLLQKYQLPGTVFLPTGFIGTRKKFWTDCFAYLLYHRKTTTPEKLSAPDIRAIVEYLNRLRGSYDDQLEAGIKYFKKYPLYKIEKALGGLSEIWHVNIDESGRDFLTWAEITKMMESGLVSFGSHTVNHQILTTLDDMMIKKELIDSRKELLKKNVLDSTCISFCYPNGNHTKEIADMVRSSGYHLATTTRNGWNHADGDRYTLKRLAIHEDMTSITALFACRIADLI